MRGPSPRCLPNTVDLYRCNKQFGASGDGQPSGWPSSPDVPGIPCSVQISNTQRMADGQLVISSLPSGWVEFGTPMGLKTDDKLVWVDLASVTHNLFVLPDTDGAGHGAIFGAWVEERI